MCCLKNYFMNTSNKAINMETLNKISILLILSFSLFGCSAKGATSNKDSSNSTFSFSFPNKEEGLTLEQITEQANSLPASENKKVRYTWHIEEELIGTYPMNMAQGGAMEAGRYTLDMVTETKNNNLNTNITIISGTPITDRQKLMSTYTSSVTARGWLSYHSQRRQFKNSAQEGEGFEERFYNNPLTLWMMSWGNRPANASIDGQYFESEEYERGYNLEGYCTTFYAREFHYMKGTLKTFRGGSHYYDGSYEMISRCTIEYLD